MGIELENQELKGEVTLQSRNPILLGSLWPIQFLFSFSSYIYIHF